MNIYCNVGVYRDSAETDWFFVLMYVGSLAKFTDFRALCRLLFPYDDYCFRAGARWFIEWDRA